MSQGLQRGEMVLAGLWSLLMQCTEMVLNASFETYLKDLKACNVQNPNEELPSQFSVQGFVDTKNQPLEHAVIGSFGQSTNCIHHLQIKTFNRINICYLQIRSHS